MRFAIRVDASSQIGTGHFMRCLTLADALQLRGAQVHFISRYLPEHFRDKLAGKGHEFILLERGAREAISSGLPHAHWLGTSQHADAQDTVQVLSDQAWDWLIVDHYALDAHWESVLRPTAKNIMVIDDIADRQHDCDVLLDQNYHSDMQTRYADKVPAHCQLLLGPHYAILREEFRKLRNQVKPRVGKVKRILVFLGGVDAGNYTGLAIEALSGIELLDIAVDVVIGAQHPCRAEIEQVCATFGYNCHVQTSRMAELMATADLAIGAGGSATWERCCLGLPTITLVVAKNQEKAVEDLADAGVVLNLGDAQSISQASLCKVITLILNNEKQRTSLSMASMDLVPASGVKYITDVIEGAHV